MSSLEPIRRPGAVRKRSSSPFSIIATPSLRVSLAEEILFLNPPSAPDQPTWDPSVQGTVHLWLPKARTLRDLTVKLVGKQEIEWPNDSRPREGTTILTKQVELVGEKDVHLEKGEHTFSFMINVPSSTAPYERCKWGKVKHFVTAKAKLAGGGPLASEVASKDQPCYLPGGEGNPSTPPPPLNIKYEGLEDNVGPYTVGLSSGFILVAGLLLLRVGLVGPPAPIIIHSIKVRINQNTYLKSNEDPNFINEAPVDTVTVCSLDAGSPPNNAILPPSLASSPAPRSGEAPPGGGPLARVEKGQEWSLKHLARLPNDTVLRPTTQPGTVTGIRVKHTVLLELIYRVVKPGDSSTSLKQQLKECKKLVVAKPLELYSCVARPASLTLPVYQEENPVQSKFRTSACVCDMSFEDVIEYQGKELLKEEAKSGLTFADIQKYDARARGRDARTAGGAAGPSTS